MSLPPSEIPLGAMRFNSDSQKFEYWMGSAWMQIKTFSPTLDGGGRGICIPGDGSSGQVVNFFTIPTAGNATDFGDASKQFYEMFGFASRTRAVFGGGNNGGDTDAVDYYTISSTGNYTDFGNSTFSGNQGAGHSNQTRGISVGANSPSARNDIQFFTCLLYTSPSPRDPKTSRMPSSA